MAEITKMRLLEDEVYKGFMSLLDENEYQNEKNDFMISKGIYFSDDIWNFKHLNSLKRYSDYYKFDFSNIPVNHVIIIKHLIFKELIIKKNKYTTVKKLLDRIKTFINELDSIGVSYFELIDVTLLEKYFNDKSKKNKASYIEGMAVSIKKLFESMKDVTKKDFKAEILFLKKVSKNNNSKRKQTSLNKFIPDQILNQIVSYAIRDLKDETLSKSERIASGLLVLIAENGMRVEELIMLERNMSDSILIKSNKVSYLKFRTFKTTGSFDESKMTYTYLNSKSVMAYEMISKLACDIIDNLGESSTLRYYILLKTNNHITGKKKLIELRSITSKYSNEEIDLFNIEMRKKIFINMLTGQHRSSTNCFRESLIRFFLRHRDDFKHEGISAHQRKNISFIKIESRARYDKFFPVEERKKITFEDVKKISILYINPHAFRVTVCTKLFQNGVHIDFIIKHMNHLSDEMTLFYNKSEELKDELIENIEVIKLMASPNGKLETCHKKIEDNYFSSRMEEDGFVEKINKINEFLEKNKINLFKDINRIIKLLDYTKSPIIENEYGVCIRSAISTICEQKKYFSSASDHYYIGIQLDTYKFINYSYKKFKEKEKIVLHNKNIADLKPIFVKEYEKEVSALKLYIEKTLLKEMKLLISDIDKKGEDAVSKNNADISCIITRRFEIIKEAEKWIV